MLPDSHFLRTRLEALTCALDAETPAQLAGGVQQAYAAAFGLTAALGVLLGLLGIAGVNLYTRHLADINAAALTPRLVVLALAISLLLGLLSGLLPARNASRLAITEALGRV